MEIKILNFVEAGNLYKCLKDNNLIWLISDNSLTVSEFLFLFFSDLDEQEVARLFAILFGEKFLEINPEVLGVQMVESLKVNQVRDLIKQFSEIT